MRRRRTSPVIQNIGLPTPWLNPLSAGTPTKGFEICGTLAANMDAFEGKMADSSDRSSAILSFKYFYGKNFLNKSIS